MTERLTRTEVERIARLREGDTAGVEATTHPVSAGPRMRDDQSRESLPRDEAVAGAPDAADGLFRVPKVIG